MRELIEAHWKTALFVCGGAAIALALLVGKSGPSKAPAPLEILAEVSPDFAEFSAISQLAQKKELALALQRARQFTSTCATLNAFNLIRIAMLEGELGNASGELAAWEEFAKRLSAESAESEAYRLVAREFSIGKATLFDYIVE